MVRAGDKLVVEFNSAILFDTGQATLRRTAKKDLDEFGEVLKRYAETDLVIEGHTDSTGAAGAEREAVVAAGRDGGRVPDGARA